jgi:hypothetical protein
MTTEQRFWSKVDKSGDCWLWTGTIIHGKYGQFWDGAKIVPAHRFSYSLAGGSLAPGEELDHKPTCPKHCVNPDHIRPTTRKQNMENLAGPYANSKSGIRGVWWRPDKRKWRVSVGHNGGRYFGGHYNSIEAAEAAAIALRNKLFTHNDLDRV